MIPCLCIKTRVHRLCDYTIQPPKKNGTKRTEWRRQTTTVYHINSTQSLCISIYPLSCSILHFLMYIQTFAISFAFLRWVVAERKTRNIDCNADATETSVDFVDIIILLQTIPGLMPSSIFECVYRSRRIHSCVCVRVANAV